MPIQVAIIIVNYRTPELTVRCLRSLQPEITDDIRVVIVDNASGDGSAEQIEQAIERLGFAAWAQVLRSPINGGFAAGNNFGIRSVEAAAYLLLNSDTLVQRDAIAQLRAAMRARPDVGIIGPGLVNAEGQHDDSAFRAPPPLAELARAANGGVVERLFPHLKPALPRSRSPIEAEWLGFACVLVRAQVFRDVGELDERYFMYFEDIDFCRRARAAGWKILYWPAARVVHLLGGSSGVTAHAAARRRAPRYYYESRARYFASYYGRRGLLRANGFWYLGRALSRIRELTGATPQHREHEAQDIWIGALQPRAAASRQGANMTFLKVLNEWLKPSCQAGELPSHAAPLPSGRHNQNPRELGLLELLAEDFATYDRNAVEPGFWVVALHRLGNARMDVRSRGLRAPLTAAYHIAFTGMNWLWGIDLDYTVKLGRRVRLWHHGGMVLGARAIGDDVHIRHNTTFGLLSRQADNAKPIIGSRVDIGVGACVLGAVTVGDDSVIGANSVVTRDLPRGATVFGIPARPVNLRCNDSLRAGNE